MEINQEQLSEIDESKLPESIVELFDLIGREETLKLLTACGGRAIYIPKKRTTRSILLKTIDEKSLHKLSERYCGETIPIPKIDHVLRQIRNMEIIKKSKKGESRGQLVMEYKLSSRQIGNIRRSTP